MKKSIVFDFGGVLIDWSPYHLYRKLLPNDDAIQTFLEEIDFYRINARIDAGMTLAEWGRTYSQKFPQHSELIEAFAKRWVETNGEVIGETLDILREVKSKGYPVYGLSNWSAETFPLVKDRFPFLEELDDYLLSGMVGQIKPGEEIFRSFLKRVGRTAEECIFIDDNAANIETAGRLGFYAMQYHSPEKLRQDLLQLGI